MKEEYPIPKSIAEEFNIVTENIKYPDYLDEEFQESISDNKIDNYTEVSIQKIFKTFFSSLTNCKTKVYEIIGNNIHNIQEYCSNKLNEKIIIYILYFYIYEKFIKLIEDKYYNKIILNKEIFFDEIINECINNNKNFLSLYQNEYESQNDKNKLLSMIGPLLDKYNKMINSKNIIGNILIRTLIYLYKNIFIPFEQELKKYLEIKIFEENNFFWSSNSNEDNEIILLNIVLYLKKIAVLEYALYNSCILSNNDICNLDENSKEWKDLKKILFRIIPKNAEVFKNNILERRKNPDIGPAIISNIHFDSSTASLIFSGIKNFIYYKTREKKSKIDSKKFLIKNMNDMNFDQYLSLFKKFKSIFSKVIPNVEFRKKIYVKKEFITINKNYIQKLLNFMKGENNPIDSLDNRDTKDILKNESLPLLYKDKIENKSIKRNYVSVTILHSSKLYFKNEKPEKNIFSSFFNISKSNEEIFTKNEFKKNTIIIAVHGGGFIGSSTFIHERYLRKWCKEINIPIFGINYSLAPKYKYPEGVNDIFQAYMWILKHAKEELNMDIKHIILTGDSAGGNLILSLNNLLIVLKEYEKDLKDIILLPELVLLFYPVTYVNLNTYSNSFLLSLNESLLNSSTLKYMCEQYVGDYPLQDDDMFLNPIKLNKFILDRIKNKIRIFFGSCDILRDDSIRLLNKFCEYNNKNNENKIDVRGYDIKYFGHGFNGFSEDIQKISRSIFIPEIEEFLNGIN
jgi:hormone-sensitive lipase